MKEKRFYKEEIMELHLDEFVKAKAFRLLGIFWKKWVEYYIDPSTQELVFRYE